jgi:hypothetical protein
MNNVLVVDTGFEFFALRASKRNFMYMILGRLKAGQQVTQRLQNTSRLQ